MSSGSKPSMAALGVQHAFIPDTKAKQRARYFNSANAFNIKLHEVPAGVHTEPFRRACEIAQTSFHACDQSALLGCDWPATTPFMLARYARIQPEASLRAQFAASGSIWYVIAGSGCTEVAGEMLQWQAGDVFLLPAGEATLKADVHQPAILWVVTDEPLLAHHGLTAQPDDPGQVPVHFTAEDIARQIDLIYETMPDSGTSGMAVVFASASQESRRNLMPALTLSLNTLPPQCQQPPHLHNSAAITLVIAGDGAHSRVNDEHCAWSQGATLVTPAGAPHSHHNDGSQRADFLIVQDGGLYYQARTMGFTFL